MHPLLLAATPPGEPAQHNGSVGRALPPWTLACLDDDGQPAPPEVQGDIAARGGLINPVLRRMDPSHQTTGEDWFRTGDFGQLDAEGRLQVTGRTDDRINRGGQKIAPTAVEATLQAHPQVFHAVVFPIPDAVLGQRVAAAVVPIDGTFPTERELRAYIGRLHPEYMVPERIIFVSSLPENRAGKLDRQSLATQLISESRESALEVAGRYDPRNATENVLVHIYRQLLERDRFDLEADFMALGGDSFQATTLLMRIEDRFGVLLTPAQFLEHSSVTTLAALLGSQTKGVETPHITAIQEGDHTCPLFFAHSIDGYAWYAHIFARYFQPSQTVYTLEWQEPVGGQEPHESLEHYAASFIDSMLECEPVGPYCLAGHSFGAQFVFELSRQLLLRGHAAAFVALIDDEADLHKRRFGICRQNLALRKVRDQCIHLLHRYVPQAYPGALTLVRAEIKTADALADPDLGWRDLALGPLECLDVPGDHHTIMSEFYVAQWASLLESRMAAAEQRWVHHQQDPEHVPRLQARMEAHQQREEVAALTEARRAAKAGDLASEIRHYRDALRIAPQQPYWVHRNLAQAYWRSGESEPALEALRQAISEEAVPIVGYRLLANWLRELGRQSEEQRCLDQAAECVPDIPHAQHAIGRLMLKHGRPGPAELFIRRAVALQAGHRPALSSLSALLKRQGHHDEALAIITRLVADRPDRSDYLLRYAALLLDHHDNSTAEAAQRRAKAIKAIRQSVALSRPEALRLRHDSAVLLAAAGQMQAATETFQGMVQGLPASPDGPPYLRKFWRRWLPLELSQWLCQGTLAAWQLRLIARLAASPALVRCYLHRRTSLSAPHSV